MSEQSKSPDTEEVLTESAEASPEAEKGPGEGIDEVKAMLEDSRAKADEHWNQLLRIQAELENTRRRAERDIENAHKYALEGFAKELLPVKDSLEMGLTAASGDDESVAKLREGMELTLKMMSTAMDKFGIKEVDPTGEPFNPELHQAMTMQESSEQAPNTVLAVMQKGYLLNERLIRPAMVIVAKAAQE